MNETPGTGQATGKGGEFTARDAARLMEQAGRRARRRFEPYPPLFSLLRAVIALVSYGTVWLTVRGQHPYHGPDVTDLLVVLVLAAVNLGVAVTVAKRATAGITGRSRLRSAEILIMAVAWIAVFVAMGFLDAGASRDVTYGLYPVSAPLIVAGLAWSGIMATRADWPSSVTGLAVAVVGAVSAFAGPAGAWATAGVGLAVVLIGRAVDTTRRHRVRVMNP